MKDILAVLRGYNPPDRCFDKGEAVISGHIHQAADAIAALRQRIAALEAERDALRLVVTAWVSASDKFERAVATYNARVMFCRAHELGLHNVDTEYGLMENARRARDATLAPMLSAARAALKEGKP